MAAPVVPALASLVAPPRETLYNGITLPAQWPPRRLFPDDDPVTPPYLAEPPAIIPIDVGRQLFVDDFLIEETTLSRTWHRAEYYPSNPVLKPDTAWEHADEYADRTKTEPTPTAMVFSDGVFFDPADGLFKMWYMGGWLMSTCLATSKDGIQWERPAFDVVPGTNIVSRLHRDSGTVWIDAFATTRSERYKMALFNDTNITLLVSADGVHWSPIGKTGVTGDRTTFFYNPFRRVWVFGLRDNQFESRGRFRRYWEHARFDAATGWSGTPPVAWVKADSRDFARPELTSAAELYNLDCAGYESVLLGLFTIWRGESTIREKINELTVGFSRDGFHWDRGDRQSFIPVSENAGSWNWANVQSAGGCCLIVGDRLHFYVSGRQGRPGTDAAGICSTGLATLRRDGFASMDWLPDRMPVLRKSKSGELIGELITRPVTFSGAHLFVNADLNGGDLRVEVLDRAGRPLPNFTRAACRPVSGNATKSAVEWTSGRLADLAGQPVRFRFSLTRGRLFAFWASPWPTGESRGFVAAGGPGFRGPVDTR